MENNLPQRQGKEDYGHKQGHDEPHRIHCSFGSNEIAKKTGRFRRAIPTHLRFGIIVRKSESHTLVLPNQKRARIAETHSIIRFFQ